MVTAKRPCHGQQPRLSAGLVLGVLVLVVLTVALGAAFAALLRAHNRLRIVVAGLLFGLTSWALLQYFLLPVLFPLVVDKASRPAGTPPRLRSTAWRSGRCWPLYGGRTPNRRRLRWQRVPRRLGLPISSRNGSGSSSGGSGAPRWANPGRPGPAVGSEGARRAMPSF